jgi:hypothetical protein
MLQFSLNFLTNEIFFRIIRFQVRVAGRMAGRNGTMVGRETIH